MLTMISDNKPANAAPWSLWRLRPLGLAVHSPSFAMLAMGWSF